MSAQPAIPQAAFPVQIGVLDDGTIGAATTTQDSMEDVLSAVAMNVACPQGAWVDAPRYGVPSYVFAQAPLSVAAFAQAISDPRVYATAVEYPDLMGASVRDILLTIAPQQPDQ